jgi:hypothetical protein
LNGELDMQNVEPYGHDPNVVVVIQRLDLGAEREAVQRVRVEGVFRVVHGQRPEALCRRQLAFGEGDCIRLVDQQLGWRVMGGVDEPKALYGFGVIAVVTINDQAPKAVSTQMSPELRGILRSRSAVTQLMAPAAGRDVLGNSKARRASFTARHSQVTAAQSLNSLARAADTT